MLKPTNTKPKRACQQLFDAKLRNSVTFQGFRLVTHFIRYTICLLRRISSQPIIWEQPNAFNHVDMVKMTQTSEWGKIVFQVALNMALLFAVGARHASLSISRISHVLGFTTKLFLGFTVNDLKKRKDTVSSSSLGKKCLVQARLQKKLIGRNLVFGRSQQHMDIDLYWEVLLKLIVLHHFNKQQQAVQGSFDLSVNVNVCFSILTFVRNI